MGTLFVAVDDHARLAFTTVHPDEKQAQAMLFLRSAVAYYATMGLTVQRLLTDNGQLSVHVSPARPARS